MKRGTQNFEEDGRGGVERGGAHQLPEIGKIHFAKHPSRPNLGKIERAYACMARSGGTHSSINGITHSAKKEKTAAEEINGKK